MGETHSVDIVPDETPDPAEEIISKLQKQHEEPDTAEQPSDDKSLLAGKFEDAQQLEKAYLELQKKLGSSEPAQKSTEEGGKDPAFSIKKEGAESEIPKSFNAEKYQQEFMENGSLSEDSIAEIKALGVPDAMIDTHMAGLQAIRDARASAIRGMFGSDTKMESVMAWASNNLTEAEITAIENQANSTDMAVCEAAIRGLVARYDSSPMGQANVLEGATGGPAVQPFRSNAEMVAAMNDPRYAKDEAYRKDIEARIMAR